MHPGPMNRGVEIGGDVADSAASLIAAQVEAGLVVRMAVLYDLVDAAAHRDRSPARRPRRWPDGARLVQRSGARRRHS